VVVACEVALEAAHHLHAALALGFLALQVGAGLRVDPATGDRDYVQCAIELAVAAAVKVVTLVAAGGDGDRRDTRSPCEVRVGLKRCAPAVCPIRIAAQSGPQPVWASSSGAGRARGLAARA
jgi:hypothetical protein